MATTLWKWFTKLQAASRRTMIKIIVNLMDIPDHEKKLLIKMRLEEEQYQLTGVAYGVTDPNEKKAREELKEKLKIRDEKILMFLYPPVEVRNNQQVTKTQKRGCC